MDKSQGGVAAEKKLYDVQNLIKRGALGLLYAAAGYFCGACALPFGARPFGFALLAAADKNAFFIYIGLVLSCTIGLDEPAGILLLGIYTAELLIRALVRFTLDYPFKRGARQSAGELVRSLFSEHVGYRLLCSVVCTAVFGLCALVGGGLLYYDLIALALSVAVAPVGAYAFYCFFCRCGIFRDVGFLSLSAVCVYAAMPLKIYGVSVAVAVAVFVTLLASQRRGILRGLVVGAILGAIYSFTMIPALLLCALCGGAFWRVSINLAVLSSFFTGVGWAFYINGIAALNGFFGGSLAACLAYSVFFKLCIDKGESEAVKQANVVCQVLGDGELDRVRLARMNRRMSAISDGLEGLSEFFEEIKLKFSRKGELEEICRRAFELSCEGCSEYASCRERGMIRAQTRRFCQCLQSADNVDREDVDELLLARCPRLPDILDEINYNSGARRRCEDGDSLALDYKALSALLERSIEGEEDEYFIDDKLSARVCRVIDKLGLDVSGAMVYGKRKRTVCLKAARQDAFDGNETLIIDTLSAALPFEIDVQSTDVGKCSDGYVMSIEQAEEFCVEYVCRSVRARGEEEFCGDSMALFRNADNRFFALVSDGMGSGRDAAAVSEICTRFARSMLDVGRMNDELLGMLNGFLRGWREGSLCECSATLDLMELDLVSGEAVFLKSGAAPSYVFRDGSLFKLRLCTMPMGILEQPDAKRSRLVLSDGDVVVMMSDGVTGGKDECPWLFDLLYQNIEAAGLERTAELILKYAIGHGSKDDISLALIKIERANV